MGPGRRGRYDGVKESEATLNDTAHEDPAHDGGTHDGGTHDGEAGERGASGRSPFTALLALQDLDTAIGRLEHRRRAMPERAELAAVSEGLSEVTARREGTEAERSQLVDRQRALEEQIGALNERRRAVEDRLYSARGSAARDLQAMDEEVHHLAERRGALEDDELALMEAQEPLDEAMAVLDDESARLREQAEELARVVAGADQVIDTELAELRADRDRTAATVPPDLTERYETLRAHLKGTGAARLVGNRCEGCHLELPSVEIERIHRLPADVLVTCDQCGRILVRTDERQPGP